MTSPKSWDFPFRTFLKHKFLVTSDCCVLKYLRRSADWAATENSAFNWIAFTNKEIFTLFAKVIIRRDNYCFGRAFVNEKVVITVIIWGEKTLLSFPVHWHTSLAILGHSTHVNIEGLNRPKKLTVYVQHLYRVAIPSFIYKYKKLLHVVTTFKNIKSFRCMLSKSSNALCVSNNEGCYITKPYESADDGRNKSRVNELAEWKRFFKTWLNELLFGPVLS